MPGDPLSQQFNLKRAILEARLPVAGHGDFVALNTHLDAFAQGSVTMGRQVAEVDELLASLTSAGLAWAIGGDFNLLPSEQARGAACEPSGILQATDRDYAALHALPGRAQFR